MSETKIKQFKEKFQNWSGFELQAEIEEEVLREIEYVSEQLQQEIHDYAQNLKKEYRLIS